MWKIVTTNCVFLFLLLAISSSAVAQTVTGTVREAETDIPLIGVNILVKGTLTGTSTNADGQYSLNVSSLQDTLVFSYIGYNNLEIPINGRTTVDAVLSSSTAGLEELVVVGYGSESVKDLTGSVANISSRDLENIAVNNLESTLQGMSSGVFVNSTSGTVGEGISVSIRGSSSLTAGNQPLYVIDGIPIVTDNLSSNSETVNNPLASIDINDIESISVLKDASAAAIYGSRASNGVVIINTRTGQSGKTRFNASYQVSTSSPTNTLEFMNAQEYVDFFLQAAEGRGKYDYRNNPGGFVDEQEAIGIRITQMENYMDNIDGGNDWRNNPLSFDWQDQIFRRTASHQFQVSAAGGNDRTTFYIGGGFSDDQGMIIKNSYTKFSGRINLDYKATDRLNLGVRLNLNRTINDRASSTSGFNTPMQAISQAPISPVFEDADPSTPGYQPGTKYNSRTQYDNNIDMVMNSLRRARSFHTISNLNAEYDFTSNIKFKTLFGMDLIHQNEDTYTPPSLAYATGADGTAYNAWTEVQNYTFDNTLTYKENFLNRHDVEVLLGTSFNSVVRSLTSTAGQNFPSDDFTRLENAALITSGRVNESDYRFISYFGRANYKFLEKYLVSLSARIDGSSRFGKNNRYGFFPAGSIGWLLSDEDFLQDVSYLSFLKARLSYGVTGNAEIQNFPSLGLFSGISYSGESALAPSQIPNPDLKWETTRQLDAGLDFGFFNQRISGTIDYYIKNTHDLLLAVDVPGTSGFDTQLRNVGKIVNRGLEFEIKTTNIDREFTWNSGFNISFNRNKITDLGGQILKVQSYANRYVNRGIEGHPIGVFHAIEYAGVDPNNGDAVFYLNREPTSNELNNNIAYKVSGRFGDRYVTADANYADEIFAGNPNPDFSGGFSNTFSYKGVSLYALFSFVYGNSVWDANYFSRSNGLYEDNQLTSQLRAWKNPGDITDIPEARLGVNNGATQNSTRNLFDGSYLRLKNLTISYDLPVSLTSRMNLSRVRLFATGTNLLTFTNYPGYDPELGLNFSQSNLNIGNAFYTAPQARTLSIGINLDF